MHTNNKQVIVSNTNPNERTLFSALKWEKKNTKQMSKIRMDSNINVLWIKNKKKIYYNIKELPSNFGNQAMKFEDKNVSFRTCSK